MSNQRAPRRSWPLTEKRRIVELTLREGASIRAIARAHGVNEGSLSHWKAAYRAGTLVARSKRTTRVADAVSNGTLLPVTITGPERVARPRMGVSRASDGGGCERSSVQLTLSSGAALRVETGPLDAAFVCALLAQLQR